MRFVLDASVAAKWFSNEDLTDKAMLVRDAFLDGKVSLYAPEHLLYEVGNSVWKNKALDVNDSVTAIESLVEMKMDLISLDIKTAGRAMMLARKLGLTYYDAVYACISEILDIPLLTADRMLFRAAKNAIYLKEYK